MHGASPTVTQVQESPQVASGSPKRMYSRPPKGYARPHTCSTVDEGPSSQPCSTWPAGHSMVEFASALRQEEGLAPSSGSGRACCSRSGGFVPSMVWGALGSET